MKILLPNMSFDQVDQYIQENLFCLHQFIMEKLPTVRTPRQLKRFLKKVKEMNLEHKGFTIYITANEMTVYLKHYDEKNRLSIFGLPRFDEMESHVEVYQIWGHAIDRYYERENLPVPKNKVHDFFTHRLGNAQYTSEGWATTEGGLFLGDENTLRTYISSNELKGAQVKATKEAVEIMGLLGTVEQGHLQIQLNINAPQL